MLPAWLANSIIILVSVMLAINFGAQFLVPGYRPDPAVYGIFMGIVGGAYAVKRKTDKDDAL